MSGRKFGISPKRDSLKMCLHCKKEFLGVNYQKYCSTKCSRQFWYLREYVKVGYHPWSKGKSNPYAKKLLHLYKKNDPRIVGDKNPMKNPENVAKLIKALHKKPNSVELLLIELIKQNDLPYKFVGNGEVMFGTKNPDFIQVNGKKKIIEVFSEYWHVKKPRYFHRTEQGTKEHYKKYGFDVLIVWDYELEKNPSLVLEKIRGFENGS